MFLLELVPRHARAAAVHAQRDLELQRAVERKNIVREHQKLGSQRKEAEKEVQLAKLKESRESKREELDEDALTHLTAYSSLGSAARPDKYQGEQPRGSSRPPSASTQLFKEPRRSWDALLRV